MSFRERGRLLKVIGRRVELVGEHQSPSSVQGETALAQAQRLRALLTDSPRDQQARFLLGWFHFFRFMASVGESESDMALAMQLFVRCYRDGVELARLPQMALPSIAQRVDPDLQDAALWEEFLAALDIDQPGWAGLAVNTGLALVFRPESQGSQADLDRAVELYIDALNADLDPEDVRGTFANLGHALVMRSQIRESTEDLTSAISAMNSALDLTPAGDPEHPEMLNRMAGALTERFIQTGDSEDLVQAIGLYRRVTAAVPGQPTYLAEFGTALRISFVEVDGDFDDLQEGIGLLRQAVRLCAPDDRQRYKWQFSLGTALRVRGERTASLEDLDEAVIFHHAALRELSEGNPDRAAILNGSGLAYLVRYRIGSALEDIDEAIKVLRLSAEITPSTGTMSNLGTALRARFERTGNPTDLDAAIDTGRRAVAADPGVHAASHANLAVALMLRYRRTGSRDDLDEAIGTGRLAVTHTPAGHSERSGRLSNLGLALQARSELSYSSSDLDAAISYHREAAAALTANEPQHAVMLVNLAGALHDRHELTGSATDHDEALQRFEEAAYAAAAQPTIRLRACRAGADLAADQHPSLAAALLETGVRLLPRVAPRRLSRSDQQHSLGQHSGLAADAAALALTDPSRPETERPARALSLLEAGRAVLYSQALETRTDLSELAERHPDLARRFTELRDLLDAPDPGPHTPPARTWNELLAEIRALPGFAGFARPPSPAELAAHASHGAIVVINISDYRSDALIVTTAGVTHLPLPALTQGTLLAQADAFHGALDTADLSLAEIATAHARIREVLAWLWDQAAGPVLEALGHSAPSDEPPRVWWMPGGLLSFLPLHAAGHHTNPPDPRSRTVPDRVVSSYTPTIAALSHARRSLSRTPVTAPPDRAVIVAMPTTPGHPGDLPQVPVEAALVARKLPGSIILTEPDPRSPQPHDAAIPTRDVVLNLLTTHSIAHFACHGTNSPDDPSDSRLLLHDHRTAPLTVAALTSIRLEHARLAYLSACETAVSYSLIDEVIHLASAFQLAGYPHVIGTLWPIDDSRAVQLAEVFYAALTTGGHPAFERSAHALYQATQALRARSPLTPAHWASHLHTGA
ncbi:CHAT domain-containing protein [Nonomuraea sp. GTA35]|uniref:CHAT domain-containing protein n=1 Tax=Nonomuraea sp. GTA35 TaxID=1676746 RepID=UPI0035C0C3D0